MDSIVTARVPAGIKEQGRIALQKIGATPTDLVNAAYRYVLHNNKLPEVDEAAFVDADKPRKLTKKQKDDIREKIDRTTFAIPLEFWDKHPDKELLTMALEEKYACAD